MRNRLWRDGVTVTTIKLGQVDTDMLKNADRRRNPITPERAADLIWRAIEQRKQTVYVPWWWGPIGWAVRHLPSVHLSPFDPYKYRLLPLGNNSQSCYDVHRQSLPATNYQ